MHRGAPGAAKELLLPGTRGRCPSPNSHIVASASDGISSGPGKEKVDEMAVCRRRNWLLHAHFTKLKETRQYVLVPDG